MACYKDSFSFFLTLKTNFLHIGVLISLWLFLFPIFVSAAQQKEFFLDGLMKLEQ
jgi:hypothetical protein